MSRVFSYVFGGCVGLGLWGGWGGVAQGGQMLVLGDSLSKEYRSEFVALYPDHPKAWAARNWGEILGEVRGEWFSQGEWGTYPDWRLTGYEFNWAMPGGTVRGFRNFLRQNADAQLEILASSGGAALWSQYPAWRTAMTGQLGKVDKVVIFLGGNDWALGNSDPSTNPLYQGAPKQIDYASIYDGGWGEASNGEALRVSIRANLKSVIDWFRVPRTGYAARFDGPMVLCAVPHVGCTPKVQAEVGKDPGRTAVITQLVEGLNVEMEAYAKLRDVGFANVYAVTKQIMEPGPYCIGGVEFLKEADADCGVRYLFSGDGFHPNTAAQAKLAQVIGDAFRSKYPALAAEMPRLGDREILTGVLGLPGDLGYVEWMEAAGIAVGERGPLSDPDGDGMANMLEYALGGRWPEVAESAGAFEVERGPHPLGQGEVLRVTWRARFGENAYCDLVPEVSRGLREWQPVRAVTALPDGRSEVLLEILEGESQYFRLAARRP